MNKTNKNKFLVGSLAIMMAIFIFGILVSGFSFTTNPTSIPVFNNVGQTKTITIGSSENFVATDISDSRFDISPFFDISSNSVSFSATLKSLSGLAIGSYTQPVINITNATNAGDFSSLSLDYVKSFCRDGPKDSNNLILDVTVRNRGEGRVYEWQPLDKIEVQVRLTNNQIDELRDTVFKIGLFQKGSLTNVIEDMIWVSADKEEYDAGDIREGRASSRYNFEFVVDPSEVKLGEKYILVVKAYPDGKESTTCIDYSSGLSGDLGSSEYFGEIEIRAESTRNKMVIIDEIPFSDTKISGSCGQNVNFFANLYNIGSKDYENSVRVSLYNSELGINIEETYTGDLYSGDKATVSFSFDIPRNATEKTYPLYMKTHYDYRESTGTYRETSANTFTAYLDVKGNCVIVSPVIISASLESESKAGKELIIKTLISNTGSISKSIVVDPSEYSSWAEIAELPSPIVVGAQETGEVLLKFNVRKDVSGIQMFKIDVYSGGELLASQPVSVNIEPRSFLDITGFSITNGNLYLWGLGLLNIILVLVIIIVAIRVAKKK